MPMAIRVLKQDVESFRAFEIGSLYMDLAESIISRLEDDFLTLKAELYSVHHIEVRRLGNGKYKANNEILEFTSEELKEMTREVIEEYLMNTKEIERKSRPWNPKENRWE